MKLFYVIVPVSVMCFLVACTVTSPPAVETVPAFKGEGLVLSADADKAYTDRPITFTARCTTVVNGKGHILFSAYCDRYPGEIHVESPIDAMLIHDSIPRVTIPMTFVADRPVEVPIRCRFLQPDVSCFYNAAVIMDSVFVADSNRYFDVNSDIAQPLKAKGYGYIWSLPSKGGTQAL